jgi:hypothetical protein
MLPAAVPPPKDDTTARAHLCANVQAAEAGGGHPGDWSLHHYAVHASPGDFTPFRPPDYIETEFGFLPDWAGYLAGILGPDHPQAIARRGRAAELEAGS